MSRELLNGLAGGTRGAFRRWLDDFQGEPRIAWYPSAGFDFRDLMYLHPRISEIFPAANPEPPPPELFIHTDYFQSHYSDLLLPGAVVSDGRTRISIGPIEELPRLQLPVDEQICHFAHENQANGRVVFFRATVESDQLGAFSCPVIYAFVENAAFCAKRILPSNPRLSHIVHVRFGGGCGGGGRSTGIWLLNILRNVNCECLVSDDHYARQSGDERIYELFPTLAPPANNENEESVLDEMETIRVVPSKRWSGHGNVSWHVWRHYETKRSIPRSVT